MREGFLLVGHNESGPMASAEVGDRVARPALGPPWFAVTHDVERVLFTDWPARLFRVGMLPAATPEEQANLDFAASKIRADAGYTRVLAVEVLQELPASVLFGPHGERVAPIADVAATLTLAQAAALARVRHPGAAMARSRVWRRWLQSRPGRSSDVDGDHSHTLDDDGSPIGRGMGLLFGLVWKAARARGGPDAFRPDPHPADDGDEILQQPWYDASAALLDAAIAEGAPNLLQDNEADVLCQSWRAHLRTRRTASVVLHEERTDRSWRTLTARLTEEGDLHVEGQDLSRSMGEYEWAYTVKAADLPALKSALPGEGDDLLAMLATHCTGREADRTLRDLLKQHAIPHSFWSRIDE
ncbi:hypothetical protein Rhe02_37200 [Rhizocola hellebori]|uniref:Uncharacterized protein n=1 Tax=Rhizocola hellebori TaxID=1392758 RepID=A0A8J3VH84_9ACTN|nr:hypothetical protein [Rhizocola hellebori]GIH05653.1 hypothetical protein Rhe02_37200 [Rhizocola hellebori]